MSITTQPAVPTYLPILKAKRGELSALEALSPTVKDAVLPLFEVPPIAWARVNGQPVRKRSPEAHLEALVKQLKRAWLGRRFLIDLSDAKLPEWLSGGQHVLSFLFERLRAAGLEGVPVIRLVSSAEMLRAAAAVVAEDRRGLCVRARRSEGMFISAIDTRVGALIEAVGATVHETDLILDGDDFEATDAAMMATAFSSVLSASLAALHVRTLAVAGSSFPSSISAHSQNQIGMEVRGEWFAWLALREEARRVPVFSDYGIGHPDHHDAYPWVVRPFASIRYTADNHWLIARGMGFARYGNRQFHSLARQIVGHRSFRGRHFSVGDEYIAETASNPDGGGNLEVWRRVGTNHHITEVVSQVLRVSTPTEP